jgi:hypothetical protein
MSLYPKEFPIAQGLEIVTIAKQNQVKLKLPVFAYDLWVLQGYVQRTFVGDPDAPSPAPSNGGGVLTPPDFTSLSVSDPIAALEKVCNDYQTDAIAAEASVPWKTILIWALQELGKVVAEAA